MHLKRRKGTKRFQNYAKKHTFKTHIIILKNRSTLLNNILKKERRSCKNCNSFVFSCCAKNLSVLHLFNNSGESLRVVEGEVGEDLAVHFDTALVDKTHELGVAEVVHTRSSVDTLYPESAEVALFVLAVAVSVGKTFFPGVFSNGPYITAATEVSTGKFEDFLAACARSNVVD